MIRLITKRGIIFLSFLLLNTLIKSQNLVPNWDFEEYYLCPDNDGQFDGYIKYWFNPTNGTPNYLNTCSSSFFATIPDNGWGYNYPLSGNGYSSILVFSQYTQEREYISIKLTDSLLAGTKYCLGYYINLTNGNNSVWPNQGSRYAIDRMGIYISKDQPYFDTLYVIPETPQIEVINDTFFRDTTNWMLVYGEYTALGGEQYITLGNFDINENTNYLQVSNSNMTGTYIFIDDAFVYKCSDVATAEAGEDVHVCKSDSVQIGMQTLSGYKYKWLPSIGLSNDTIGNPYTSPQQTTKYYLYLNKYIETVDSVTVFVDNCGLQMPNAFTPDGNGKNDIFKPLTKGFKEIHGKIFNRWGMQLYEWSDVNGGWDGKYNSNYVSSGVYFYIIEVTYDDGSTVSKKGTVEVIR